MDEDSMKYFQYQMEEIPTIAESANYYLLNILHYMKKNDTEEKSKYKRLIQHVKKSERFKKFKNPTSQRIHKEDDKPEIIRKFMEDAVIGSHGIENIDQRKNADVK